MNFDEIGKNQAQEKAWAIASDPSASENKWLAACTILEGKQHPAYRVSKPLPRAIGLPWSVGVSAVSGLGAFMIFGFLTASACELASLFTGSFYSFNAPHAFTLLSAAFIAFSLIFTYQQHIWGGGKVWTGVHYALVAIGALLPFYLELLMAPPSSMNNLVLFSLWGLGFMGISAVSQRLARTSIQALESSVGASRVIPHSRTILVSAGTVLLAFTTMPVMLPMVAQMSSWWPVLTIASGYCIAYNNRAFNPQTGAALAVRAWSPLILANFVLLPALITNSLVAMVYPLPHIPLADYAIGAITLAFLTAGPVIGARIGSFVLRQERESELHRAPEELLGPVASYMLEPGDKSASPLPR